MADVRALQQERINLFQEISDNIIPKRVPVNIAVGFEPTAQFSGLDRLEAQWKPSLIETAAEKMCQTLYSDVCPAGSSLRYPSFYQALESNSFVVGSNGFMQHPEVVGMGPEDYDFLIEKPYDCLIERVLPKHNRALNGDEPFNMAKSFTKSLLGFNNDYMETGMIMAKLTERYGYYPGAPLGTGGFTEAPFDFLADFLRSFSGVSMDVRRIPEKVAEACEALYPLVLKRGMPTSVSNYGLVFIPLHMPTFMREKDFAKLWWPSFKKMVEEYASMGVRCRIFCEDDWTRYLDYLYELPAGTLMMFEYGDPKQIKEKLGKKHIITGLYPISMLTNHTKEQSVDKAKELIDILAPGGNYIFSLDKNPLDIKDINMENLCAVTEYVRDHAVYSNAGETAGIQFNKADYKVDSSTTRKFESKYYSTWDQYKAKNPKVSDLGKEKLQSYEEKIFQYVMFLFL